MAYPTKIACCDCNKAEVAGFDLRKTITGCSIEGYLPMGWEATKLPFPDGIGFRCPECHRKLTQEITTYIKERFSKCVG